MLRNFARSENQNTQNKRAYYLKTFAKLWNSPFRTLKLLK